MSTHALPNWLVWQPRAFPNANFLAVKGTRPALVDSGFVAHAEHTRKSAESMAGDRIALVVNTHWHSDHVGGNRELQRFGAAIAASVPDAEAVRRRDPGCCAAAYLDQPVAPYSVDIALRDGDLLRLGDSDWQVVRTPGHTSGHLSLWQPEERILAVGDALSDYDVGWVWAALDGPQAAATALQSIERIAALKPRVLLPAHGPVPQDVSATLASAHRRVSRLVDDPSGAVWYGARRVFGFALMIYGGIPLAEIEDYLRARSWAQDAARELGTGADAFISELLSSMRASGAIAEVDGRVCATADHDPPDRRLLNVPWPDKWPPASTAQTQLPVTRSQNEGRHR